MYYYLYEIRNNINGKIYVGVHKTKVLDDGYMGSGKIIKAAIEKYGIDNFTKTILEYFETSEEMFAKEKEIVNEEFLAREDTYNLRRGGHGGWDYINANGLSYSGFASIIEKTKTITPFGTEEFKEIAKIEQWAVKGGIAGAAKCKELKIGFHNDEVQKELNIRSQSATAQTKRKETMAANKHSVGEKNSQYGTMWITDGVKNKKIKNTELIPIGWIKGRK